MGLGFDVYRKLYTLLTFSILRKFVVNLFVCFESLLIVSYSEKYLFKNLKMNCKKIRSESNIVTIGFVQIGLAKGTTWSRQTPTQNLAKNPHQWERLYLQRKEGYRSLLSFGDCVDIAIFGLEST